MGRTGRAFDACPGKEAEDSLPRTEKKCPLGFLTLGTKLFLISHFAFLRAIVRYYHIKILMCVLAPRLGKN